MEAAQKLSEEIERRRGERLLDDMRFVLSSAQGRRLIWWLLSKCGVFRGSFNGSAEGTFFNEGMRQIGLYLFELVTGARPEAFAQMQSDHSSEAKKDALDIKKVGEEA